MVVDKWYGSSVDAQNNKSSTPHIARLQDPRPVSTLSPKPSAAPASSRPIAPSLGARLRSSGGLGKGGGHSRLGGGLHQGSTNDAGDVFLFIWAVAATIMINISTNKAFWFTVGFIPLAIFMWVLRDLRGMEHINPRSFLMVFKYLGFVALYGSLGYLFNFFSGTLGDVVLVLFWALPAWPFAVALSSSHNSALYRTMHVWMTVFIIILVLILVITHSGQVTQYIAKTGSLEWMASGTDQGRSTFGLWLKRSWQSVLNVKDFQSPENVVNPDPYYGEGIEESGDYHGVSFYEFKPYRYEFAWDQEIVVTGLLESESLLDRPIEISVICNASFFDPNYIDYKNENIFVTGKIDMDKITVQGRSRDAFACSFPSPEWIFTQSPSQLPKEIDSFKEYLVEENKEYDKIHDPRNDYDNIMFTAIANFTYDSWGTLTYLFMDRTQKVNYESMDKDIYTEFGVEEDAIFHYTPGPMKIGTLRTINPIGVANITETDFKKKGYYKIDTTFTSTLESNWNDGRLTKINSVIVHVPQPITFETFEKNSANTLCKLHKVNSKLLPTEVRKRGNYNYYVVDDEALKKLTFTDYQDYMTISCPMLIEDWDAYENFMNFGGMSINTFVVEAKYNFELKEETSASVRYDASMHGNR